MRILALDSASGRCSASLVAHGELVCGRHKDVDRGQAGLLPMMAKEVLAQTGTAAADLDLVAVTVGPGSFTGIRGGVALAQGIAIAAGVPVVGVTVGEALAESLPQLGGRALWVAIPSRRGRVFLEIEEQVLSLALTDLPCPERPLALAGALAAEVASRLAARGANVMLTDARLPWGRHVASVAARRFVGTLRPLPAEPVYVDPPEARPSARAERG